MLHVSRLAYTEWAGAKNEWLLEPASFEKINLIVGRNSSGKSRVLAIIHGLSNAIQNRVTPLYQSGAWKIEFTDGDQKIHYELAIQDRIVVDEKLSNAERILIQRDRSGAGFAWSQKLNTNLEFGIEPTTIAVVAKRDSIQHPFLEVLHQWSTSIRRNPFGSELGRNSIFLYKPESETAETPTEPKPVPMDNPDFVTQLYIDGEKRFGENFKKAILRDFDRIGYKCTDIFSGENKNVQLSLPHTIPMCIGVKEADLDSPTLQHDMSMGMYRALALIVHITYGLMTKKPSCILIDDIGEGLDFERSSSLIQLIIDRALDGDFQLIMTTNDRFVMNEVDLKYWHIINRHKGVVRLIDRLNSGTSFDDFRFLGLNNFDFFASKAYLNETSDEAHSNIR